MLVSFRHCGQIHEFNVEMTKAEQFLYERMVASMNDAHYEAHKVEAIATRGVSLRPRELPVAAVVRTFYLQNGRFPTQAEMLRRLAP